MASSSSRWPISTRRSNGRSATRPTTGARSKSARWRGLTPPTAGGTTRKRTRARVADELDRLTRDSYGRLLALLAAPSRDIAAAEDALADAMERALTRWPDDGIPANPEALDPDRRPQPVARHVEVVRLPDDRTARRNRQRPNRNRRHARHSRPAAGAHAGVRPPRHRAQHPHAADAAGGARRRRGRHRRGVRRPTGDHGSAPGAGQETYPRCRHPVRRYPSATTWPSGCPRCSRRSTARTRSTGSSRRTGRAIESLSAEALHLALVLTELLPDEPEVLGLAALMCLSEARRPARRTDGRDFVPLDEQDTARGTPR